MSEWPVFHMTGRPPASSIAVGSACEHFTSKMIGWPRPVRCEHVARVQNQNAVAPDDRAVAVDDADAIGVAVERDAELGAALAAPRAMRSSRFSGTVGSGWWFGNVPSLSQKSPLPVDAERVEQLRRDERAGAVAAVVHDARSAARVVRCARRCRRRSDRSPSPSRTDPASASALAARARARSSALNLLAVERRRARATA